MDRTSELYEKLDAAKNFEGYACVEIVLGKGDFVKSPAHTNRNVYGPGKVRLQEFADSGLLMTQYARGQRAT